MLILDQPRIVAACTWALVSLCNEGVHNASTPLQLCEVDQH